MIATAATESQIRALIDAIDRADQAGNRGEAERALAQARAAAPDHPGVLNVAGMRQLLAGDAGAARPLLERAAALDPISPSTVTPPWRTVSSGRVSSQLPPASAARSMITAPALMSRTIAPDESRRRAPGDERGR